MGEARIIKHGTQEENLKGFKKDYDKARTVRIIIKLGVGGSINLYSVGEIIKEAFDDVEDPRGLLETELAIRSKALADVFMSAVKDDD